MSKTERKLLIVEDDPGLQKQLRWSLDGFDVILADNREDALAQMRRHQPSVVTLDLGLPPDPDGTREGFATLEAILEMAPNTNVIVVSGNQDRDNAVAAVGLGAYDFYQKPVEAETLQLIVNRAFHVHELETENRRLSTLPIAAPLAGILTASESMLKVCRMIEKLAPTNVSTLLLGDSGTGKELLARALHDLSPRAGKRFIAVNCGAIPENLLESELFGYERGAFTGAAKQTIGKIEMADGGTFFLDEVGDLPGPLQVKLLRFLQERCVERIGGRKEIPVDVRIICATHQNLGHLIAEGRFREDLYYRISEVNVDIPPLRDRHGDAVLLARHFLHEFNQQLGTSLKGFTRAALEAITTYDWPGNVRELENRVKRAMVMAENSRIGASDLELQHQDQAVGLPTLRQARERAERDAISLAMTLHEGKLVLVADTLGISRPTLYNLLTKHDLK